MTELEALKMILEDTFELTLNMNDTFYYATGDCETLEGDDLLSILPVVQKYGTDALVAYVALKRGHDPTIPQNITKNFNLAKKELKPLFDSGDLDFEAYYENKKMQEQKEKFNGQVVEWSTLRDRFVNILNANPNKWRRVIQVAKLKDGTLAVGGSAHEAETRLKRKFDRKNK